MRFLVTSILLTVSVGLGACANMSTVSRTTWLWPLTDRAIHLDAQQRLVLVRAEKYCAEPSPDALASYAAALGLGLGEPGKGAGTVAQALQSNAASIGLRTQSITLMRDALYRICEATANETLGKVGAATALARSQDLTAVVLAIEQLTGAVAAPSVILTSEAGAKASASLIEMQKDLKAAEKEVEQRQKSLSESQKRADQLEETNQQSQNGVEESQKVPEEEVKRQESLHEEAVKDRDKIRELKEEIRTQATAITRGAGQFGSIPIQRNQLDAKATKAIATAITSMVKEVLKQDYTLESCTELITNFAMPEDAQNAGQQKILAEQQKILEGCRKLVLSNYKREAAMAELEAAMAEREAEQIREPCSPELGNKIDEKLTSNPTVRPKIKKWLKEKKIEDPLIMVLARCRHASLREELYKKFFSKPPDATTSSNP